MIVARTERIATARKNIDRAFAALYRAQDACDRWTERRMAMQPGADSRARLSTVAARWSSACEERDRREQALRDLGVDLSVAVRP